MRTGWFCAAFILLLGSAAITAQKEKGDSDRLQGEWEIVKLEQEGTDRPDFVKKHAPSMVFTGNKYAFKGKDEVFERGEFKLDPKAKVPSLDYTITEGQHKGKRQLGIYRLDGDMLKICLSEEGATKRPGSFTTRVDAPEYVLFTLKRKKKE